MIFLMIESKSKDIFIDEFEINFADLLSFTQKQWITFAVPCRICPQLLQAFF